MNRNFLRLPVLYGVLSMVIFALGGCRERTLISSKVSPANDTANVTTQVLGCITHTYLDNDVFTSTNISGVNMNQAIGCMVDSFFGTTVASTFFQISPENAPGGIFTATQIIDSAILILPYSGFTYGDSDASLTQSYQAFYITDTLGYYTPYFPSSDKSIDVAHPLSAPVTVNLHSLRDSVYVTDKNAAGLRIPLNLRTLMPRLNAALVLANLSITPSVAFVNAFNGICVRPADTRNFTKAMPYFRLDGTADFIQAGVMVYYHDTATPAEVDSMSFNYAPSGCAHFNNITKSYRNYPVNNLLYSTRPNDSIIAMQNQPGAGIDFKVYGINSIPPGVVVSKAQIQISVLPGSNPLYALPERIYPIGIGNGTFPLGITAGLSYIIEDQKPITSLSPYTILDGIARPLNGTGPLTYTIGIPREVMACIAARNDTLHLHLNGTQDYLGAFHLVAGGGNYSDSAYRAKLIVVYSALKR